MILWPEYIRFANQWGPKDRETFGSFERDLHALIQRYIDEEQAAAQSAIGLSTPPQEGWQPISTEPGMATKVLLWASMWRSPFVGTSLGDFGHCLIDGNEPFEMWGATHWMPLPAPPALAALPVPQEKPAQQEKK